MVLSHITRPAPTPAPTTFLRNLNPHPPPALTNRLRHCRDHLHPTGSAEAFAYNKETRSPEGG